MSHLVKNILLVGEKLCQTQKTKGRIHMQICLLVSGKTSQVQRRNRKPSRVKPEGGYIGNAGTTCVSEYRSRATQKN